ncbi:hypothetical protein ACPW96_17270 [Micromonospora sp. DT81.3]|uniref:hypothetical protein n=1 Tax=Actinomycetes TaxID=1760 RepID=UPI003CF6A38C
MTAKRSILALSAGIALVTLLSACASGPSTAGSTPSSAPSSSASASGEEVEVEAAWLNGGTMIGLVSYGSSTCVPTVDTVEVADGGTLSVTLADPEPDTPCTMDYVPRVTLVDVPADVDPSQDLKVEVTGDGFTATAELDGIEVGEAPDEYGPTAGWTGEDDSFVILTWGSSTCAPVIESVEPTGPAEVTVTFMTPPADQVCTMDMAPRGTLATVSGLEADSGVELVLTGGEFTGARVVILGEK